MNLGRRPVALEPVERLLEQVDAHAVGVHVHLHHVGLVRREHRHGAGVGRALGDHHVARVDQRLRDEVDHLLAAGRDDHVLGCDAHALGGHHLGDAGLGLVEALGGPVLERLRARLGGDPLSDGGEGVRREGAGVGQPARERDHLGASGHGHQVAHGRGLHDPGARGEQAGVALDVAGGAHALRGHGGNLTRRRVPTLSAAHEPLPRHRHGCRPRLAPPASGPSCRRCSPAGSRAATSGSTSTAPISGLLESPAFLAARCSRSACIGLPRRTFGGEPRLSGHRSARRHAARPRSCRGRDRRRARRAAVRRRARSTTGRAAWIGLVFGPAVRGARVARRRRPRGARAGAARTRTRLRS